MSKIYVAISKNSGNVMSGIKGQYAYGDTSTIFRSLGQAYTKPKEFAEVFELTAEDIKKVGVKVYG
ncbi:hypothetical protein V7166_21875 [Bacillus thuringiensis]